MKGKIVSLLMAIILVVTVLAVCSQLLQIRHLTSKNTTKASSNTAAGNDTAATEGKTEDTTTATPTKEPTDAPENTFLVKYVKDGDTLVCDINGKEKTVRLIGVDTPESVHADESKNTKEGKQASEYTKNALTGKHVTLEYDVDMYDDYDRILAYVYLDGKMYNLTLLEEGMARTMTIEPNTKYADTFSKAESTARERQTGFWAGFFAE